MLTMNVQNYMHVYFHKLWINIICLHCGMKQKNDFEAISSECFASRIFFSLISRTFNTKQKMTDFKGPVKCFEICIFIRCLTQSQLKYDERAGHSVAPPLFIKQPIAFSFSHSSASESG